MAKQDEIVRRTKSKKRAMEKAQERVVEYQQEIKVLETRAEPLVAHPQVPEGEVPQVQVTETKSPKKLDMAEIVRLAVLKGKLAEEEKKATRKVKPEYYVELKKLFRAHGVPFMTAIYEAEQAGSWLVKNGFANVMVSDDYDCLLCGAPFFFQHFHSNKKNCTQRLVYLEPLLKHLNFTRDQFVDFCILAGTDFGGHLPGIGAVGARRIIQKHGDIDAFLASDEARKYRENDSLSSSFNHKLARRMFTDDGTFPLSSVEIQTHVTQSFDSIQERFVQEQNRDFIQNSTTTAPRPKKIIRVSASPEKKPLSKMKSTRPAVYAGVKRARLINL
jgi:5'-3' exonuclease